jgi:hypothetical protein
MFDDDKVAVVAVVHDLQVDAAVERHAVAVADAGTFSHSSLHSNTAAQDTIV